jgi:hypothetical protein
LLDGIQAHFEGSCKNCRKSAERRITVNVSDSQVENIHDDFSGSLRLLKPVTPSRPVFRRTMEQNLRATLRNMRNLFKFAVVIFCVMIVSVLARASEGRPGKDLVKTEPVSFTILDPDSHQVIGHAEYKIERLNGRITVRGENHYNNGEYDIERDELVLEGRGALPTMEHFEHTFFNADGSPKLIARADPRTGDASCASYEAARKRALSKKLEFPSDTYAGAAAVVAMETAFRDGREHLAFYTYDCAPGPILAPVIAQRGDENEYWDRYPKPLIRVQLTAKLGWFGSVLGGLFPHRNAWFDPVDGWQYVGGRIQRYLAKGPQVILVRKESVQDNATSDAR